MSSDPSNLEDLIERAKAQARLRDHRGSFDNDCGSPRAECWPFIKLAVAWASAFPRWTLDDWMGKTL